MNYEFHPEAELEVLESAARYDSAVPGLGLEFGDEVERVIEENPALGAAVEGDIRHFVLRCFPFSVIYAVVGELIYVLAVAHGARGPGYWKSRLTNT